MAYNQTKLDLVNLHTPEGMQTAKDYVIERVLAQKKAQAEQDGTPFDETKTRAELESDPRVTEQAGKLVEAKAQQLQSKLTSLGNAVQTAQKKAVQEKAPPPIKIPAPKQIKTDTSVNDFVATILKEGGKKLYGMNAYITPLGVYYVQGGTISLIQRPMGNNGMLSDAEFLQALNAKVETPVNPY